MGFGAIASFLSMVAFGYWVTTALLKPKKKLPRRTRRRKQTAPTGCGGAPALRRGKRPKLSKAERWAIAAGAPLADYRGDGLKDLHPDHADDCLHDALSGGWGITDTKTARETLDWLQNEGHEADFQARRAGRPAPTNAHRDLFVEGNPDLRTIRAWDLGRISCVARWSYALGYLDEEETWERIFRVARAAQQAFDSWRDYVDNYRDGHDYWNDDGEMDAAQEKTLRRLLNKTKGPLAKLPWDQALD